ncbi:hypothetical protein DFH06DRAFT_1336628 [Mycena polygramma]|nr:hypothetical protein DFH06DRAFT_1336628 [Mycena polygramma]
MATTHRSALPSKPDASLCLPPELLDLVFWFFVDPYGYWIDVIDERFVVLAVCRRWRAVALASAKLWTRLVLRRYMRPSHLELCIENSGDKAPLEVEIDSRVFYSVENMRDPPVISMSLHDFRATMLEQLRVHLPRVTTLKIVGCIETDVILRAIEQFPPAQIDTFEFTAYPPIWKLDDGLSLARLPGRSPAQMVFLSTPPLWTEPEPYSRLARLELISPGEHMELRWNDLRMVLEATNCLLELILNDVACTDILGREGATLPSLAELMVVYSEERFLVCAGKLTAPNLSYLDVYARGNGTLGAAVDFIPHLFPIASTIFLTVDVYEPGDLDDVLPLCTSARHMDLVGCSVLAPECLVHLARVPGFTIPNLLQLDLRGDLEEEDAASLLMGQFAPGLVVRTGLAPNDFAIEERVTSWFLSEGSVVSNVQESGNVEYI